MSNLITLTTVVGAIMLIASVTFLVIGIRRYRRTSNVVGSESKAGPFILIGFALLAIGSLAFLFGIFRPGP